MRGVSGTEGKEEYTCVSSAAGTEKVDGDWGAAGSTVTGGWLLKNPGCAANAKQSMISWLNSGVPGICILGTTTGTATCDAFVSASVWSGVNIIASSGTATGGDSNSSCRCILFEVM